MKALITATTIPLFKLLLSVYFFNWIWTFSVPLELLHTIVGRIQLDIALQGTGVVRNVTTFEDNLKLCNNLKQIHELATQIQEVKEAIADSVEAPKTLLYSLFNHFKLKGEPVSTFHATSDEEIQALWEKIKKVNDTVSSKGTNAKSLESKNAARLHAISLHLSSLHIQCSEVHRFKLYTLQTPSTPS